MVRHKKQGEEMNLKINAILMSRIMSFGDKFIMERAKLIK